MNKAVAAFIIFLCSSIVQAAPFRIALFAENDAESVALAWKFANTIRQAEPFSRMGNQLEIKVYPDQANSLKCVAGAMGIPHLLSCNTAHMNQTKAQLKANRIIAVTARLKGAAGGSSTVLGNDLRPGTPVHELFHTFGMGDEYDYPSRQHYLAYCNPPRFYPNVIPLLPSRSYVSDAEARTRHKKDIPWFSEIKPATLITTGTQLGTTGGLYPKEDAAFYRGGECSKWIPTWKPYYLETVMVRTEQVNVMPLHSKIAIRVMEAEMGRKIQLLNATTSSSGDRRVSENFLRRIFKAVSGATLDGQGKKSGKAK